ncbi:MAG: hypothetical protein WCS57_06720, partial [Bacillota bacterium]
MRSFSVMYIKVCQREFVSLLWRITRHLRGDASLDAYVAVCSSLQKGQISICLFDPFAVTNRPPHKHLDSH